MKKVIYNSRLFKLTSDNVHNPKKRGRGLMHYTIELKNPWIDYDESIRDIVDPNRNISGAYGRRWTFKNRETAEKLYTTLVLWYP